MTRPAIAFAVLMLTQAAATNAADLLLVDNGQPAATIVVAADEPQATNAAEQIRFYIARMSGAELPVVNEKNAADLKGVLLLVGHTKAAAEAGIKVPAGHDPTVRADAFEEEGYILRTKGKRLFIGGNSDGPYKGTLYAAYDLLKQLGCRWYFPGEWGEIVPQHKTLTLEELDIERRPDFPARSIWLSGWIPATKGERELYNLWATRVGMNMERFYPVAGDGFLGGLLPAEEYWETHPEFDVTELVEPGRRNTVTIRVWNDAEIGGLYRRGFFWSPAEGE